MSSRSELIRKMHDSGMTFEEIGNVFGITKQGAQQAMNAGDGFHMTAVQKVKYIGLRNWMLENRVGFSKMAELCGKSHLHQVLTGKCSPNKQTIDAILAVTGLTYEECFKEDPEEENK